MDMDGEKLHALGCRTAKLSRRVMDTALCSDTAESTKSRFKNARIQLVGWSALFGGSSL